MSAGDVVVRCEMTPEMRSQLYAALNIRGIKFSHWLREQAETLWQDAQTRISAEQSEGSHATQQ
jgi:hypothetical protein